MGNTRVLKIDPKLIKKSQIDRLKNTYAVKTAARYLLDNEVVAFPTETVYGLGANALNSMAVKKIFKAKGRPSDNPLILHISKKEQLYDIIDEKISEVAEKLMNNFWPGPLTLIFNKSNLVPAITTADLSTVAVRMPSHPVTLALIDLVNIPLAAPSANSSGFPSPTKAEHVYNDLNGKIPLILDGGICNIGVESTVIEIKGKQINILRPGGITREMILEIFNEQLKVNLINESTEIKAPKSPGMKYKHYAPETPLYIVKNKSFKSVLKDERINKGENVFILSSETFNNINKDNIKAKLIEMGSVNNLEQIAKNIFSLLREVDRIGYELILIEEVPSLGIGEAIMNRLRKAAIKII